MPGRHFLSMGIESHDLSLPAEGGETGSGGRGSEVGQGGSTKERLQQWIKRQSEVFLERWCGPGSEQNPALEVMKRLGEAALQLDVGSPLCGTALQVSVCPSLSSRRFMPHADRASARHVQLTTCR